MTRRRRCRRRWPTGGLFLKSRRPSGPSSIRAAFSRSFVDQGRFLAILSNVDRDLLELSIGRLGIRPDLAITAEDAHSYKPAPGHWRRFLERSGASVERTVHVGASQFHDMRPAAALGFRTVFIDRHGETLETSPTRVLPDLSTLPDVIRELAAG